MATGCQLTTYRPGYPLFVRNVNVRVPCPRVVDGTVGGDATPLFQNVLCEACSLGASIRARFGRATQLRRRAPYSRDLNRPDHRRLCCHTDCHLLERWTQRLLAAA